MQTSMTYPWNPGTRSRPAAESTNLLPLAAAALALDHGALTVTRTLTALTAGGEPR